MVSFGLVTIPVRLVTAVREREVRFTQLHAGDGGRIQYKRFCAKEDREVPYEDIARGYPIGRDRFVVFEKDELERLEPRRTRSIDIDQFAAIADVDPIFYDRTYYLLPDGSGETPYRLLLEAMADAGKIAIGRFVMREKEHLVAIRASGHALVLQTLYFADEIVRQEDMEGVPAAGRVEERQLRLAHQLVESLADEFRPERYHDEFRAKVEEAARKKAAGEEVVPAGAPEQPSNLVDLMDALQRSVEEASAKRGDRARGRRRGRRSA